MGELSKTIVALAPFLFVLALVWMVMFYRRPKPRPDGKLAPVERAELAERAERMEQRIEALERILDAESPGWRNRHDRY